jgi:nickel-type superoxide dismutase maturation protease
MLPLMKFKVVGHSMEPVIKNGGTVLVSNLFYWFKKPSIGDIVAFRDTGKILIKRIKRIQGSKYFLTGDNQKDSIDSRQFGLISKREIIGKVFYKA